MSGKPGPSASAADGSRPVEDAGEAAATGSTKKKAHRDERPGGGFATRGNYFTVEDIVWARPPGHPFWPGEIVGVVDEAGTLFRCRLFHPPKPELAVLEKVHGNSMFFFDHLATDAEVMPTIEERLQRKRHDVSAYEEAFIAAVRAANSVARVTLNPDPLFDDSRHHLSVKPVGVVHCFHRTHTAAPRQPHTGEVSRPALGVIKLARGLENAIRDLKGFERIWVTFQFSYATMHSDIDNPRGFSCMVVPPRDSVARGVFATRSPHRPNSIGLSCVRLVDVRGREIHIADHDLLHGTPVLDIKPYLPFCDAHPTAKAGWVDKLNASGKAKGDHRVESAPDVALVRNYAGGKRPTLIDPYTGLPQQEEDGTEAAAPAADN